MSPLQNLSDAQHIRSRPGMYVGGLNPRGRRFLITSIVEDLLNLPDAERPRITTTLLPGGSVEIDARGAAPDLPPQDLISHFGPGASLCSPHYSFVVAAALCDPFDVEITRAGRTWSQSFARGVAAGPLREAATSQPARCLVRLRPDPTLFPDGAPEFHAVCGAFQALALFHPAATLSALDQLTAARRDYHYPRGLLDYVAELEPDWVGHPEDGRCWTLELSDGPDRVRAAILLRPTGPFVARSFLNGRRLIAGTHVDGFRQALAELATRPNAHPNPHLFPDRDPAENMTVAFALELAEPDFESATKDCLAGPRSRELAYRMMIDHLAHRSPA